MADKTILLIYPKSGKYDVFIKDLPLSLLYAARICHSKGFNVKIIDQRVDIDWKDKILKELSEEPLLAGISVMTGKPIHYAIKLSKFIKANSPVPIVWGGIHPTILPDSTLKNPNIDFLIRGYGELPLFDLATILESGKKEFQKVNSLSYKNNGQIIHNERNLHIDMHSFPDVSYDLVDVSKYIRFDGGKKVFSVITSFGCPHLCKFCYYPSYNKPVWWPQPVEMIIDKWEKIIKDYKPTYLSVIDNDFFVDLKRANELFEALVTKKWNIRLGFRGVRVDELDRMSKDTFALMEKCNVEHLHIGAESGSQRILDLMGKKITIEQIIRVNRKMKKFPKIIPRYNFFSGIPTEEDIDIKKTTDLILKLLDENPYSQITAYNQFTPYPGTELYNFAIQHGFTPPDSLEGWVNFDEEDCAKNAPWVNRKRQLLLDTLYLSGLFIDFKMNELFASNRLKYRIFRFLVDCYRPLARYRFKNHFTAFPLECSMKKALNVFLQPK